MKTGKVKPSLAAKAIGEFLVGHDRKLKSFALERAEAFRDAAAGALDGWAETYPQADVKIDNIDGKMRISIYLPWILGRCNLVGPNPTGASPSKIDEKYPGLYSEASALNATFNKVAGLLEHDGRQRLADVMLNLKLAHPGKTLPPSSARNRITQVIADQGWNNVSMSCLYNEAASRLGILDNLADYFVQRVRDSGHEVSVPECASDERKFIAAHLAGDIRDVTYVRICEDFFADKGLLSQVADILEDRAEEENQAAADYDAEMNGPN